MVRYLNQPADTLKQRASLATAQEIAQQPGLWREAEAAIIARRAELDQWLDPILEQQSLRVLFCGAGSSSYIGDSVVATLRKHPMHRSSLSMESVSTTDLVVNPMQYLDADAPTLMVSFGRSGDSPESVACIELGVKHVRQCWHLVITCNSEGALARWASSSPRALCVVTPDGSNDQGFAMTSSYTSMLVSCMAIFAPDHRQLDEAATCANRVLSELTETIAKVASAPFDRMVVLGAGVLRGTADEAALKCLELTAGRVVTLSSSPLGFRHGPKVIITSNTLVVHLRSGERHAARYDQDLINEIRADAKAGQIVELSLDQLFGDGETNGNHTRQHLADIWLSLVYVVYCQILAFLKSYSMNIAVDNPCPSGEVNRVVSGVSIYPYDA